MKNTDAIYVRVSSEKQEEKETIKLQLAEFKKAYPNVPESNIFKDDGVSGEILLEERPGEKTTGGYREEWI